MHHTHNPIIIDNQTIDIVKLKNKYEPLPDWPKVLLQIIQGVASGTFIPSILAYATFFTPFHIAFATVGAFFGITVGASLLGMGLLIFLPALLFGIILGSKAYKAHLENQKMIAAKEKDFLNTLAHSANELTLIIQRARANFDKLLAHEKTVTDDVLELVPYIKQLQDSLGIVIIDFNSEQYTPLIDCYKTYAINKINKLITQHNDDFVPFKSKDHDKVYRNTKEILELYDHLTQLGFKENHKQEYRHTSKYQKTLKENSYALSKAKENASGYSNIKKHEPYGENRASFFNAIHERYQSQGGWAATALLFNKSATRAQTWLSGATMIAAICMLPIFVTNPVGLSLFAAIITISVLAVAVGTLATYVNYKINRDQQKKTNALNHDVELIKNVKEVDKRMQRNKNRQLQENKSASLKHDDGLLLENTQHGSCSKQNFNKVIGLGVTTFEMHRKNKLARTYSEPCPRNNFPPSRTFLNK